MSWLETFESEYRPVLDVQTSGAKRGLVEGLFQRADGFRLMFDLLLAKRTGNFKIVETGTIRSLDKWKDGQSARLFTEFVKCYGGSVRSVDISDEACVLAREVLPYSEFSVTCSDSVAYLSGLEDLNTVDLFYLDSWNVKWANDQKSAQHHLKEFLAIESQLAPGTVVAIDDNSKFLSGGRTGKGRLIVEYLDSKGVRPIYDHYQIIYQF